MSKRPVYPPVYAAITLLVMLGLHRLLPVYHWLNPPWSYVGVALITIGVVVMLMAAGLFHKRGTTIKPFQESTVLVAEGPFRFSRNPMYLSMVLMLTGIALFLGTVTPLLVIPLFFWLIAVNVIVREEAALQAKFGEQYLQYKKRVRRWL